jgi:hypothetical protein
MVVLPEPIDPVMTSTLTAPLFMREFRRIPETSVTNQSSDIGNS